jgi:hypothetical protein
MNVEIADSEYSWQRASSMASLRDDRGLPLVPRTMVTPSNNRDV